MLYDSSYIPFIVQEKENKIKIEYKSSSIL